MPVEVDYFLAEFVTQEVGQNAVPFLRHFGGAKFHFEPSCIFLLHSEPCKLWGVANWTFIDVSFLNAIFFDLVVLFHYELFNNLLVFDGLLAGGLEKGCVCIWIIMDQGQFPEEIQYFLLLVVAELWGDDCLVGISLESWQNAVKK